MVELGEMLLTFCTVAVGVAFFLPGCLRHSGSEEEQRQLGYERQEDFFVCCLPTTSHGQTNTHTQRHDSAGRHL